MSFPSSIRGVVRFDSGLLHPKASDALRAEAEVGGRKSFSDQHVCLSGGRVWSDGRHVVALEGVLDPRGVDISVERSRPEEYFLVGLRERGSKFFQEISQVSAVVWDVESAELTCVQSAAGAQPLYYTATQGVLAFASEIEVVAALSGTTLVPDARTIGLHLANRIFDESATLFRGVHRLPAGCMLVANRNGIQVSRCWDFDPAAEVLCASDDEYASEFLRMLRAAVDESITGTDRPGLLLSGGLDSSALACVAHGAGHRLNAFSLVSRTHSFDESLYIREIASATCIPVTEVSYESEVEPFLSLEQWESTTVLYSPMMRFCEALFRVARQAGSTVLVTGFGGDELFSASQQYLSDLLRSGAVLRAWRQAQYDANVWGSSRWKEFWRNGVRPLLPTRMRRLNRKAGTSDEVTSFIKRQFLESSGALNYIDSSKAPDFPDPEQHQIFWALRHGWNIVFQLEQIAALAGQYGLELRHPFLDNRLLQFVIGLPSDQRHRAEGDRYILRNAMRGLMPEKVRTRIGKADLAVVIDRELRTRQAREVQGLLSCSRLAELGAVDREKLVNAFEDFVNGSRKINASEFETVVGLELWLRELEEL